MSLGTGGSPNLPISAIRTDSKTALRQEVIGLRAENQWLRHQLAAQQEQIDELGAELKQYKNANTPPSKKGGAGGDGGNNASDGSETDDDEEESAGGDDAASDSSPGREVTKEPQEHRQSPKKHA